MSIRTKLSSVIHGVTAFVVPMKGKKQEKKDCLVMEPETHLLLGWLFSTCINKL
jgi:hypothetical protein